MSDEPMTTAAEWSARSEALYEYARKVGLNADTFAAFAEGTAVPKMIAYLLDLAALEASETAAAIRRTERAARQPEPPTECCASGRCEVCDPTFVWGSS